MNFNNICNLLAENKELPKVLVFNENGNEYHYKDCVAIRLPDDVQLAAEGCTYVLVNTNEGLKAFMAWPVYHSASGKCLIAEDTVTLNLKGWLFTPAEAQEWLKKDEEETLY